jgi:hypothetical protein
MVHGSPAVSTSDEYDFHVCKTGGAANWAPNDDGLPRRPMTVWYPQ